MVGDGGQVDQRALAVADQPGAGLARLRRRLGRPGAGVVDVGVETQVRFRGRGRRAAGDAALVDAQGGDASLG